MQLLLINLSELEITLIVILAIIVMYFALYKVLKIERGATQILWLFAIILVPPIMAIVYLLKTSICDKQFNVAKQ